ncbi:MAG: fibronectin type III domain-containing protein, partial [Proteobacteria bacterium]|nr:fibronectin type III domain-containing protein [Pseudomonadota bacterium]
ENLEVSTYTLAYSSGPAIFPNIYTSSITVAWSTGSALGYNGPGLTYMVQASNFLDFSVIKGSSETLNIFATIEGLTLPTKYYFRVKAANSLGVWNDYVIVGSTRNGSFAPINPVISAVYESSVTVNYGVVKALTALSPVDEE